MIRKILMLLFLFLFLGGCAHIDEAMNSWIGAHESQLIASWGPPQQVASDGRGGKILIYQDYVDLGQSPGYVKRDPYGRGAYYTAPRQEGYNRQRMFYVDPNGKIYHWIAKGL